MPPPGPRSGDPYRVLGVAPDATTAEVKRAYRTLAKRHHPDAAGPAATARFLAIQQAYEDITAGHARATRGASPAGGERRRASGDWYAEARDAARGRARPGRGDARRGGTGAAGGGDDTAGAGPGTAGGRPGTAGARAGGAREEPRRGPDEPGRRRASGRAGTAGREDVAGRTPRTATIGSTTYGDAVTGEPEWHGAA